MFLSNSDQIRKADDIQINEYSTPGIVLMESAGKAATESILAHYPDQEKFLILAGPGNNGGDGLVIARLLHLAGRKVRVLLSHNPKRYVGDAQINFHILKNLPIPMAVFSEEKAREGLAFLPLGLPVPKHTSASLTASQEGPILIDALLGTGIEGELRGPVKSMITFFSPLKLKTVAIDLPSGLDASSGKVYTPPLKALHTLTFHLPKMCHAVSPASQYCGDVEVLDIGIWPDVNSRLGLFREWTDTAWGTRHHKARERIGHKGSFGHVLLVGGSRPMTGAIALAARAAVHGGAGLATVFCPAACRQAINTIVPEAMVITGAGDVLSEEDIPAFRAAAYQKDVVVMGPGMGKHPDTLAFVQQALAIVSSSLVLDADALNILAASPDLYNQLPDQTILTPHPGEMKRLCGDDLVQNNRLELAEKFAQEKQLTVVLKGAGTITALPDGSTYVNRSGNAGLGSGGTGDVLAGLIGALLGQGYGDLAAAYAVWLHGHTGDMLAEAMGEESLSAKKLSQRFAWPGTKQGK